MFSKMILSVAFISALALTPDAYAGRVELTTYYPAPYGEYKKLQATGSTNLDSDIALEAKGSSGTGLVVTNGNRVGIGTTAPNNPLEVRGNVRLVNIASGTGYVFTPGDDGWMRLNNVSGGYTDFAANRIWANGNLHVQGTINPGSSTNVGAISTGAISATSVNVSSGNITAGSFTYYSDKRLKENIVPVAGSLEKIGRLTGVNFTFKNQPGEKRLGLIAQEVEPVVPEVVRTQPDGMKSLDYASLVALLIQGIKEQQQEISALREELGRVKAAVLSGR